MRLRLQRAGLEQMKTKTFYGLSVGSALVLTLVLLLVGVPLYIVALAPLVGGIGLPRYVLNMLTKRRQKQFLREFVTAIDIIVRGVKAGLPFNDCLQIITTEVGEPVKSEFLNLVEQQRVGVPIEKIMGKLFDRVPLQEVNFFAIVVTIQLQVGGNISEALSNLANVLRDRHKLKAKVQAVSMEAKSSAAIIGALPLVVMGGVSVANPEYISILFTHPTGHMILGLSALTMLAGVLVMRWMINFKI
jgi:tight adherence protein B